MTTQPPNPELAALPNLFLLDLENRALLDGKAPILPMLRTIAVLPTLVMRSAHIRRPLDPKGWACLLRGEVMGWQAQESNVGKRPKRFWVNLQYAFQTPDGRRIEYTQTMNMSAAEYSSGFFPRPGTPLAVRYVDDKHHEVL
jgi:hypothetical protein